MPARRPPGLTITNYPSAHSRDVDALDVLAGGQVIGDDMTVSFGVSDFGTPEPVWTPPDSDPVPPPAPRPRGE